MCCVCLRISRGISIDVPFTDGVAFYSVCYSQFMGSKDSFPLDEIFLAFIGF